MSKTHTMPFNLIFRVKLSDLIFFYLCLIPIANEFDIMINLLLLLRNVKRLEKLNYYVEILLKFPTPITYYLLFHVFSYQKVT